MICENRNKKTRNNGETRNVLFSQNIAGHRGEESIEALLKYINSADSKTTSSKGSNSNQRISKSATAQEADKKKTMRKSLKKGVSKNTLNASKERLNSKSEQQRDSNQGKKQEVTERSNQEKEQEVTERSNQEKEQEVTSKITTDPGKEKSSSPKEEKSTGTSDPYIAAESMPKLSYADIVKMAASSAKLRRRPFCESPSVVALNITGDADFATSGPKGAAAVSAQSKTVPRSERAHTQTLKPIPAKASEEECAPNQEARHEVTGGANVPGPEPKDVKTVEALSHRNLDVHIKTTTHSGKEKSGKAEVSSLRDLSGNLVSTVSPKQKTSQGTSDSYIAAECQSKQNDDFVEVKRKHRKRHGDDSDEKQASGQKSIGTVPPSGAAAVSPELETVPRSEKKHEAAETQTLKAVPAKEELPLVSEEECAPNLDARHEITGGANVPGPDPKDVKTVETLSNRNIDVNIKASSNSGKEKPGKAEVSSLRDFPEKLDSSVSPKEKTSPGTSDPCIASESESEQKDDFGEVKRKHRRRHGDDSDEKQASGQKSIGTVPPTSHPGESHSHSSQCASSSMPKLSYAGVVKLPPSSSKLSHRPFSADPSGDASNITGDTDLTTSGPTAVSRPPRTVANNPSILRERKSISAGYAKKQVRFQSVPEAKKPLHQGTKSNKKNPVVTNQ